MGWLRIIAGELRGRRIVVPPGSTVRPTADRVREALFSILGPSIEGARVLDAYAGSGALGFEALSRGASRAVFLESDRDAWEALRANAERLGVEGRCALRLGRVLELLGGAVRGPFDVVFADPPYAGEERGPFLALAAGMVAADGCVVVERDARSTVADALGLEHYRSARYGRAELDFYRPRQRPEGTGKNGPG